MRRFAQVDVFGLRPFAGNPVAVVLDAEGLSTQDMQAMARWTNLSETTFVLPPSHAEASYRVRIFTPRQELPFAGHPSIGTAHAVLEAGIATPNAQGGLVQECAAGLLPLRIDMSGSQRQLFVRIPSARHQALDSAQQTQLMMALGADITLAECVNVGPIWIVAGLDSGAAVRVLQPDLSALAALSRATSSVGISVYGSDASGEADLVVRSFVPADGIPEDPVCGSGNGAIAAYLLANGALPSRDYCSSQGREIGYDGRVHLHIDDQDRIWIGGQATTAIHGALNR